MSAKNGLAHLLHGLEEYDRLENSISKGVSPLHITGVSDSSFTHLIFCVREKFDKPILAVAPDLLQARQIEEDLREFYDDPSAVLTFPERELTFYDIDAINNDTLNDRLTVINKLNSDAPPKIIVTTPAALLQPTAPSNAYADLLAFRTGRPCDLASITEKFVALGYTRVDMLEGRGQFSIRGGIIDFFPYGEIHPYRVELWDDEVDSIRKFDIMTQRSFDKQNFSRIFPATEMPIDVATRTHLLDHISQNTPYAKDAEKIAQNLHFPAIDKYIPQIFPEIPTLLDQLPDHLTFFSEPQKISKSVKLALENLHQNLEKFDLLQNGAYYQDYHDALKTLTNRGLIGVSALSHTTPDYRPRDIFTILTKTQSPFNQRIDFFLEAVTHYYKNNFKIIILSGSQHKAENVTKSLNNEKLSAQFVPILENPPSPGQIMVTTGELSKGFEYPLIKTVVISDRDLFGSPKKPPRKMPKKSHKPLNNFTDLTVGDHVVHQNHGIGCFVGIKKMTVSGASSDYLEIHYRGGDKLYIPTHQLDLLYKYIGRDSAEIRLNKLGGTEWNKTKQRVKKACRDMADQLIALYAARQDIPGIPFATDSDWQADFEENFQYEETDDQIRCITEVKRDMESPHPMDRLLCGDVGYGKTEVALRAAFKAVSSGYQVALLVPTTILANQHYNTFLERLKAFPVTVELLSRFRTPTQQRRTIKKAKQGEVDIIVGTHRLLQKDLAFKKLGLLIVDEEQRFGVAHKERIKEIKQNVDVLTLTATPIPRTLHMSLIGIRDMSTIENPPKDRYPVTTYVLEHSPDVIRDAIIREISRNGQVYYLHNRVQTITKTAAKIAKDFPDLNIGIAHGQMDERELEEVMLKVFDGTFDILVCTTIIESGLDIPNVNTIIVEDADRMGLAQLYQLRGRVGRSNRLAYAYFTYRRDKVLSEVAEKRFKAVREFTEFGAGFKIALRDLEIRGAGNVLGAQQHGHMDAVGYDLYCKLLSEAIAEGRGTSNLPETQSTISLPLDAFIPHKYIESENNRIEAYKRISSIESPQDAADTRDELQDRYGPPPREILTLIEISLIRALAAQSGVSEIKQRNSNIVLTLDPARPLPQDILHKLISTSKGQLLYSPIPRPYLTLRQPESFSKDPTPILDNVKFMLQTLKSLAVTTTE